MNRRPRRLAFAERLQGPRASARDCQDFPPSPRRSSRGATLVKRRSRSSSGRNGLTETPRLSKVCGGEAARCQVHRVAAIASTRGTSATMLAAPGSSTKISTSLMLVCRPHARDFATGQSAPRGHHPPRQSVRIASTDSSGLQGGGPGAQEIGPLKQRCRQIGVDLPECLPDGRGQAFRSVDLNFPRTGQSAMCASGATQRLVRPSFSISSRPVSPQMSSPTSR